MIKNIRTILCLLTILIFHLAFISCSFSVKPVYNEKETKKEKVKGVENRDDLKGKAMETVKLLHKLMEEGKFEEAYQMIDENSELKHPKDEAISSLQEVANTLGRVEKIDLTRESVVQDPSLNDGQLQVRQEFVVKFEKDTLAPKRYEIFIWNVYPDNSLKLWAYLNSKGEE